MPSLQIARALVARGRPARSIELVRLAPGPGGRAVADARVPLHPPAGTGHPPQPAARRARGPTRAPCSACWGRPSPSIASFLARRPRVVVVVGGYASFPAGVAAVLTRVPMVLVNTDAVPGAVNGLLGRFAAANAVAFPGTDLPRARGDRDARPTRARWARPVAGGAPPGQSDCSVCPRSAGPWPRSAARWGPVASTPPWPSWPARWSDRRDLLAVPRGRPA